MATGDETYFHEDHVAMNNGLHNNRLVNPLQETCWYIDVLEYSMGKYICKHSRSHNKKEALPVSSITHLINCGCSSTNIKINCSDFATSTSNHPKSILNQPLSQQASSVSFLPHRRLGAAECLRPTDRERSATVQANNRIQKYPNLVV
ncbi:Uncharacterized protein Fot_52879 [Forsythia ovata]|uniref:Uncharacterized protein n=1 Tax=Forsythia ovata TaxID=205694 RepID=A0ABD1PIQ1_9LAMI